MESLILQLQRLSNDTNGNPRRIWLFWSVNGSLECVADEGYRGYPAGETIGELTIPPRNSSDIIDLGTVDVTPKDFKETVRIAKDTGVWLPS